MIFFVKNPKKNHYYSRCFFYGITWRRADYSCPQLYNLSLMLCAQLSETLGNSRPLPYSTLLHCTLLIHSALYHSTRLYLAWQSYRWKLYTSLNYTICILLDGSTMSFIPLFFLVYITVYTVVYSVVYMGVLITVWTILLITIYRKLQVKSWCLATFWIFCPFFLILRDN